MSAAAATAEKKHNTGQRPGGDRSNVIQIGYRRPWLYKKQRQAIFTPKDKFGNPARFSYIEASTKAGKTAGCITWLAEKAILEGKPGRNYWWVAPIFPQAKIAFRRMKRAIPVFLNVKINETELSITLPNGAMIWFKGADKPDSLYGEDVHALVGDEASRMKEEAYHAMYSTLTATKAEARFIGNVKGRKNWFFRNARAAEAGQEGNAYYKITAYDAVAAHVLTMDIINQAKRDLPEHIFNELYLAEPTDDGGNPFGLQHIRACLGELSNEPPVAIGVDLAKSIDWTVAIALDRFGRVCGIERWQQVPWDVTEARLIKLIGRTPTLADSTGVGDPVVEKLQKNRTNVEGFKFTSLSKQQLMEGLATGIQAHRLLFPDGVLRAELDLFEYVSTRTGVRYSAPEGYHDDCVVALALAYRKWLEVMPTNGGIAPGGVERVSPWIG